MLNTFCIVGRLVEKPEIIEIIAENETRKELEITLAVPRSYKNSDGVYETDFIKLKVHKKQADAVVEFTNKGDVIGARGFIGNGGVLYAEKISFLSSKKEEEK